MVVCIVNSWNVREKGFVELFSGTIKGAIRLIGTTIGFLCI